MAKRPHWYASHPQLVHVATASNATWRGRLSTARHGNRPRIPFCLLPVMPGSLAVNPWKPCGKQDGGGART